MNVLKFKLSNINNYVRSIIIQPKPFRYLFGLFLVFTKLCKFITIEKVGYKLKFHPSAMSLAYFIDRDSRIGDELIFEKYLKKGNTYVDVGANIGSLVCKASYLVGESGIIKAIEAHPKTFKYLSENVILNNFKNVDVIQSAAGNKIDQLFISDKNDDDQNSILIDSTSGFKVNIVPLDMLLCDLIKVDFLKIDIEGFELFALEGAVNLLQNTNIIYLEIGEKSFNKFGYTTKDLIIFLYKHNFECFKLLPNKEEKIDENYSSNYIENIICKRIK